MRIDSWSRVVGYLVSVGGVLAVGLALWPLHVHFRVLTAATVELIVVLLVAMKWGTGPALVSSVLSAVCINFYYVPPILRLQFQSVTDDDFVALMAYLATSILVGQLSSRAQRRAEEVQRLYDQLRAAFDRTSQLEAIKQSERLKSSLLDTVTHDLRTPLTSIKAAAAALRDLRAASPSSALAKSEEQMLSIIVQQADRLNRFIEGMIELAKIRAGHAQPATKARATPMEDVVAAALTRAEDALRAHAVSVDCEDDLSITGNPQAIAQVLFSLLENAARYSPAEGKITIAAQRKDPGTIEVSVEDEGPGVPSRLRERIFEKFFRHDLRPQETDPGTGLGLGLAIARGIVEAQGGQIWVEERPSAKAGARFVFTIPSPSEAESKIMEQAVQT
jgi:two-component system sensor histidine kinase KdpD